MGSVRNIILKTFVIFFVFLLFYYLLVLKPLETKRKTLEDAKTTLSEQIHIVVQNRLSYVSLTTLEPEVPDLQNKATDFTKSIRETNAKGKSDIEKIPDQIPGVENIVELKKDLSDFYNKQIELMEKVTETSSFEKGAEILASDEGISLLTEETNLIYKLKQVDSQLVKLLD